VARPRDFDALLRILDGELRLITPTDPEGVDDGGRQAPGPTGGRYFVLTHDYLVPALRDWLTRKQKETRRGRAEILLQERSALWNARPEKRHLPSWYEWVKIRAFTRKSMYSPSERKLMAAADKYHLLRTIARAIVYAVLVWLVYEVVSYTVAWTLVGMVRTRDSLPYEHLLGWLTLVEGQAKPMLREVAYDNKVPSVRRRLAFQLLRDLGGRLDERWPHSYVKDDFDTRKELWWWMRSEMGGWRAGLDADLLAQLWGFVDNTANANGERLAVLTDLIDRRVSLENELERINDIESLLPPPILADMLMRADEKQFAFIYPRLEQQGRSGVSVLTAEIVRELPADAKDDDKEKLANRQAKAAVALLKMNRPEKVWPLLRHRPDPRVRSYLIHCLGPLGADPGAIVKRLDEESDITIRRALILSLGEFDEKALPPAARQAVLPRLQEMYLTATDPGLHGAAEWLLRQWKQEAWLKQVNEAWAKDKQQRVKRLEGIEQLVQKEKEKTPPQWYVNGQGQTMVVIPGPVEFLMGSPSTEEGRGEDELQHMERIGRTFALAATPVTVEQFSRFRPADRRPQGGGRALALRVSWYDAAAYCNWLSDQEGIAKDLWCYETDARGMVIKLKENYLRLTGYRLPSEAEWEFACRGGAVTSRFYGETGALQAKYVGSGKPNDLGLDMSDDVGTWCQESYKAYLLPKGHEVIEDKEYELDVSRSLPRVFRGYGAPHDGIRLRLDPESGELASILGGRSGVLGGRSATRTWSVPSSKSGLAAWGVGLRPARTLRP
jgi:formylglycine-generating enzyme required for sulfatase activity